ncbi:MAG: hypothetical protein C3F02_04930 [Parcubacteria group bacterium]|nr:MAG: hypothetical protein C3F02_04930 [Parcubacteria group bacterium]
MSLFTVADDQSLFNKALDTAGNYFYLNSFAGSFFIFIKIRKFFPGNAFFLFSQAFISIYLCRAEIFIAPLYYGTK